MKFKVGDCVKRNPKQYLGCSLLSGFIVNIASNDVITVRWYDQYQYPYGEKELILDEEYMKKQAFNDFIEQNLKKS